MGWCPPTRSMMLRRRTPRASPGVRLSQTRKPSSSGPRWRIAAAIARARNSASELREAKATPQIPHTLLSNLRRREKGHTRSEQVLAKVEAGYPQPAVCIPGKHEPQHQKEQCRCSSQRKVKKRLALQQQAPIDCFIPTRIEQIEEFLEMELLEWQSRQAHMREILVIVLARIIRNGAGGLLKNHRILKILTREKAALGVLQDHAIRGIDDDPALVDQYLGHDVFCVAFGCEQEQAAHLEIGGPRQIQERVRRGS